MNMYLVVQILYQNLLLFPPGIFFLGAGLCKTAPRLPSAIVTQVESVDSGLEPLYCSVPGLCQQVRWSVMYFQGN